MEEFVNDKIRLLDMAKTIEEIQASLAGIRFENFAKEVQVRDEIVYLLREIGIGARLLSPEFKATYGDIDWDVLIGLQFASWDQEMEIDPHALWYIIENDLPNIKDQIYDISATLQDKEDERFYY